MPRKARARTGRLDTQEQDKLPEHDASRARGGHTTKPGQRAMLPRDRLVLLHQYLLVYFPFLLLLHRQTLTSTRFFKVVAHKIEYCNIVNQEPIYDKLQKKIEGIQTNFFLLCLRHRTNSLHPSFPPSPSSSQPFLLIPIPVLIHPPSSFSDPLDDTIHSPTLTWYY